MRVTKVVLRPISMNKVCALASIVLDDCFAVHDLRVVNGDRGPFVAMPSLKRSNGEFRDICHPVNTETRNEIQRAVLEQFAREGGAEAFRTGVHAGEQGTYFGSNADGSGLNG